MSYCPSPMEFRCSCQRMESIGLPCEHMVAVLVKLNFTDLPNCLVLPRWSRCAKDLIRDRHVDGSIYWDSQLAARYATLVLVSKEVAYYAHRDVVDYRDVMDLLISKLGSLKLKYGEGGDGDDPQVECT